MGGKSSRTKGHSLERATANKWREFFPDARRLLEYHSADANGVDIMNTGEWKIQCKAYKNYVPINKIDEIKLEGKRLLVAKADHKPIIYCLEEDSFLELLRRNKTLEEQVKELAEQLKRLLSK